MEVDLFSSSSYTFVWPVDKSPPSGESIIFKCKELTHQDRRQIENKSSEGVIPRTTKKGKKKAQDEEFKISYLLGHIKDLKIKNSVVGWDNLTDKQGNSIVFNFDTLVQILDKNAGLSPKTYGNLEDDLLDAINDANHMDIEDEDEEDSEDQEKN